MTVLKPNKSWDPWIVALMWVVVTAYNLFKPYNIDDPVHLEIARWIAGHPLRPMSGTLLPDGVETPIYQTNQPHLYFYILAAWGSVFGYGEAAMHVLQSLFSLAAICLFHRIARRLVPANALWLTAMLALGPAFVVGQSMMTDVPLLSLWLWFFDALMARGNEVYDGSRTRFAIAALACGAAILVKYSSLALLPILITTILWERRWRTAWTPLISVAMIAAWSGFNYYDYGSIHIAHRPIDTGGQTYNFVRLLGAWLMALGAITPFGLILIVRSSPWLKQRAVLIWLGSAASFTALIVLVALGWVTDTFSDRVLKVGFLINVAAMMATIPITIGRRLSDLWPRRLVSDFDTDLLVLLLWVAGHLSFYCLFAPFMAVRHVLLVLPAILLLGARLLPARLSCPDAAFGVLASLFLSLALGYGDWHFAAFYRDEARVMRASLPAGAHVWYIGHWGFQWYAAEAGLSPLVANRTDLGPGDFIVTQNTRWVPPLPTLPHSTRLELARVDRNTFGLGDLFCTANPSRFYESSFTSAPWLLTRDCAYLIGIFRVLPPEP